MTGLLAQLAPGRLRLCYVIYLVVLLGIGAAIFFTPETMGTRCASSAKYYRGPGWACGERSGFRSYRPQ